MGASVLSAHEFQHAVAVELAAIADDIIVFTAIAAGDGYSYVRGDVLLQLELLEDAPPCAGLSPRPGELSVAPDRSLAFGVLGTGVYGIAGIERPGGELTDSELLELAILIRGLGLAADYALGRTCVHEVGHWLNLNHIWGDASDCSGTDHVADTPNAQLPNFGEPTFPHISCGNAPSGDMFVNYMDYVDDAAMLMFSPGQVGRMNATLAGPRSSFA